MMKNLKDKEIIIGLIIIIFLGVIALFLLIKREMNYQKREPLVVQEIYEEEIQNEVEEYPDLDEVEIEEALEETEEEDEEEELQVELTNVQIVTPQTGNQIAEKEKKEYGLYDILGNKKYVSAVLTERKQEDNQLKELYQYWDEYQLDAVADLVRLERLQKVSKELEGKNKFYYYGSVDAMGRPSGKGLAVYEDNTYYFGEWKEGLRHGKGMWMEIAIYTEENKSMNLGVIEHSYNGQWSKDLPNGEGQENYTYDFDILKEEMIENECITNVIGNFKDGYYHGEMYIMSTDAKGVSTDWSGNCKNGVWETIVEGKTTNAVWQSYEEDEQGNREYHYMFPKNNHDYGIRGLKK